jgi:hypothetical protein
MRRHLCTRLFSAALALWYVLSWANAELVHSCPVHSGAAGAVSTDAAGAPGQRHSLGHGGSHPGGERHACTCIGVCCAAGVAFSPPTVPVHAAPAVVADVAAAPPAVPATPRARADHALPFANGPPAGAHLA